MMIRSLIMVLVFFLVGCVVPSKEVFKDSQVFTPPPSSSLKEIHDILALRGVGSKNILFMKVFTAGLYLPAQIDSALALDAGIAKCISVQFFAKIASKDFVNFTIDHMKPNLTGEEFLALSTQIENMRALFPDIKPGDSLALLYKPDEGTSFIHNGKTRGIIEGALFSKAIFSTWIGPKPFDKILKRQVLAINP